ncbi:MAG: PHP domain-containing protein [Proteobacteria bacterium]|nr:PHP domain-containing protein [Pseudomonadota bacterium]
MSMSLKIDLHVHTSHSPCSAFLPVRKIEQIALKRGLHGVAITDHNTIAGALELKSLARQIKVIVAEEIKTREGEIIGYFLSEKIPAGLPVQETIREIRRQGGLVSIPHPFDTLRTSRITREALEEIIADVDMIEVFNSRDVFQKTDMEFVEESKKCGVIPVVGSDAHQPWEIGRSYAIMDEFETPQDFLAALRTAQFVAKKSPIWVHIITKLTRQFK